ncbi:fructosamine kinase family protein [Marihabitans asiaticum]|uniref:Fructosamine-3-kinase n=1 Tax=Marihabitans asiaticum TaxID=415218 RepID=A0A560WH03_9MICO|nr:fructosamine kinase family protein [Marihabitans asiaticum]TWD16765.1 fructosamine-3-kinase [Marihabitans asiaticum]
MTEDDRPQIFRKDAGDAPAGYTAWEAAGLLWLEEAEATGGARVVRVHEIEDDHLDLEQLSPVPPTNLQADAFGAALAATHSAGADAFGAPPSHWRSGHGFLGPAIRPLPLPLEPMPRWGEFYGEQRIMHTYRLGRNQGTFDLDDAALFEGVAARLADGTHDTDDPPSRIHGDLWTGNVLWTRSGGVLIDPAAHGGHRETDLAMLLLFRGPHVARIVAAYDEAAPLADGWQERVPLHQLHPVMMHAVLFGGHYLEQSKAIARRFA